MPTALMPTRFSPPTSLQPCLPTNAESRMPNAATHQGPSHLRRVHIQCGKLPNTAHRARTLLEICTRRPPLCAQSMPSAPILLASHQTFCENAHLVARHESPSSSVRFKRRQSASGVEGDKAADAPDDRANTDLVTTEPTTSGLGRPLEVGRPSRAAEFPKPSWTTPRCLA